MKPIKGMKYNFVRDFNWLRYSESINEITSIPAKFSVSIQNDF